ncbi:MAG: secretion protein [Prevotella sp.]|nr:secretion protein [Prevotella sp.]MBR2016503.1 secretion protein [Prevotella sp.]MBR6593098.1 secretion protein [Prevotella sp.]MBR7171233.1 secretion protein [Prevotella sp.]
MIKKIFIFTFMSFLAVSMPAMTYSPGAELGVADVAEVQKITIEIGKSSVKVSGAKDYVLEVVSLTGKQVTKVKIESQLQRVELNIPKGCYIIKVGNVVRKVSIG